MKKRLFCLFLGLILVLPMILTACSDGDDDGADVSEDLGAQTITMRMVTEKKVFNTDEELAEFLKNECGGNENDSKYIEAKDLKAAYDRVEYEFSKITKSKYKINVDFIFYTEDEYFEEVEKTMDEFALETIKSEKARRALMKYISDYQAAFPESDYPLKRLGMEFLKYYPECEPYIDLDTIFEEDDDKKQNNVEEQYKENDFGIQELVYPETLPGQIDIIYISGLDMYNKYIENEWIIPLDEHISTTGKKLNDYIPAALLNGVKSNGSTYAIPNNVQMGEYTYMMVDKELFDKYYYDYEDINSVLDLGDFLEDVSEFEEGVLPLDSTFKDCIDQFVWYWNIEWEAKEDEEGKQWFDYTINKDNQFSIIGALYGDPKNAGRGQIELGFNNLFANKEYTDIYLRLKEYEFNNFYKTETDTRSNAAVSFVNGDYSVKKAADDNEGVYKDENGKQYYTYVVKYPEADEEAIYGNMYAVSANSQHVMACMEVITLINTNAEARNILQYGVEGTDYHIDDDTGILKRTNTLYRMDIEKTGNCFIAHPEEGLPADYWENAKAQNNDALINPLLGFDFDKVLNGVNSAEYKKLDNDLLDYAGLDTDPVLAKYPHGTSMSAQVLAKIEACETYEELVALVANIGADLQKNDGKPFMTIMGANGKPITESFVLNLAKLTDKAYTPSDDEGGNQAEQPGESPYKIYQEWMTSNGYLPAGAK